MLLAALLLLQPAPAPQPAAAPKTCPGGAVVRAEATCPTLPSNSAKPRFVFFDSGEAEIRREWNEVIATAAAEAMTANATIRLAAHSDRSGSAAANVKISYDRLRSVRGALIAAGVPSERIVGSAHGEDQPLVPTADGVREIQNRRVSLTVIL